MPEAALDSSAVLAVMQDEPGGQEAARLLPTAIVSAVNHCEVISKLMEWDRTGRRAAEARSRMSYVIADFDADLAFAAGLLRGPTRPLGLSLGDRACLALARRERVPAYTTDREWAKLDIGVRIVVLR